MRAYVLVLMSGDRCRSLRPCIALIAAVVGTIVICLLNLTALPQYTAVEYHFLTGESHSACFVQRATDIYRFVLPVPVHLWLRYIYACCSNAPSLFRGPRLILLLRRKVELQQVEDSWPWTWVGMSAVQSAWITRKQSGSAMDKIGTDVPGCSRKGRDSLSPMLVSFTT